MTLPLLRELKPWLEPEDAFRRLAGLPHVVFLDSAVRDPEIGRYSYIAADPYRIWRWEEPDAAALDTLESGWRAAANGCRSVAGLPPLQGGLVGVLAYDFGRALEPHDAPRFNDMPFPAVFAGAYDVVVAFDHTTGRAWIVSQGLPEVGPAREVRARERLDAFAGLLASDSIQERAIGSGEQITPRCAVETGLPGLLSSFAPDDYLAAVAKVVEYIHDGEAFQVNLAQRVITPATDDPLAMYLRLRQRNAAPYAAYFDLGDQQLASASPELFLRVSDGVVETRPIKGTRGRSGRPEADLFAGADLQFSEKDRAENVMIVDLLRNDLSRTCEPESVHVANLCGLERYAFVQHLVSIVRGRLRSEATPFDLLRTCFPGGSITGAPKPRAMEIIAELEPASRGAYCGTLFYAGYNGAMDSSILIRTITCGGGWWQLPVGGGIVAQSRPEDEYQETWHKARGMLQSLSPARHA